MKSDVSTGGIAGTAQSFAALVAWAEKCDAKSEDHGSRVAVYSRAIGTSLGMDSDDIDVLVKAAYLHDIGKISISRNILNKIGKLTIEEFEVMKIHSTVAFNALAKVEGLQEAARLIKYHHERYDGKGYPEGLEGEEIPLGSRIIGLAETVDILIWGAPWKESCSVDEAICEIKRCSGSQFDPVVVETFCSLVDNQHSPLEVGL